MTANAGSYDRLFNVGDNPTDQIGFSEESQGNVLAVWTDASPDYVFTAISNLYNSWVHFAIVRNNNVLELYYNGTSVLNTHNNRLIEDNTSDKPFINCGGIEFELNIDNSSSTKNSTKQELPVESKKKAARLYKRKVHKLSIG
jgi:hypothetical protein